MNHPAATLRGIEIVPLMPEHWPQVRAIYLEAIAGGQATFETDAPSWEHWDACHLAFGRFVARRPSEVLGWAALVPVSSRKCYQGVAEVSVYVCADCRSGGIGRLLLQQAIATSEAHGIWTLQGATFADNTASLRLQAACGFRVIGRRLRIAQLNGVWKDTILTERRSAVVGI